MTVRTKVTVAVAALATLAASAVVATASAHSGGGQTLTIWSYDNQNPGLEPVLKTLSKNFQAAHPGVKINIVFKDFNALLTTVGRALASGSGPDLTEGNQGFQTDGELVKAKLILPLDKYAKKYNWSRWYGPGTATQFRWTSDGKHFGVGNLYGVGQTGQHIALFYNKAKLKQLGISAASALSSLPGFEKALAAARAKLPASEPVLQLGNKEGYEAMWVAFDVLGSIGSPASVRNWIFHKSGARIDTPATTKALGLIQTWMNDKYLPADANALQEADAAANFAKGQGLFFIDGVWNAGIVKSGLKSNAGVVVMPPGRVGGLHGSIGSTSGAWHISAKSKNPDLAAAWLNYVISSPTAVKLMYGQQQIPAVLNAKPPVNDPFLAQIVKSWSILNKQNGLLLYGDWASPTMLQTISTNMQKLLANKTTPQDVAKAFQDDWAKFDKTLR